MKRLIDGVLLLALCLGLVSAPAAAAPVTPAPPAWFPAEHYLVFPGDEVYETEGWQKVLDLRRAAQDGAQLPAEDRDWVEGSAGTCYETALLRLKYAENAPGPKEAKGAFFAAGRAFSAAYSARVKANGGQPDELAQRLSLWASRCYLIYNESYIPDWNARLSGPLQALGLTLEDFFDAPYMDRVSADVRARVTQGIKQARDQITVQLDGSGLLDSARPGKDGAPEIRDGRTMIPVSTLATLLGAAVEWRGDTRQVVMVRAGTTIVMTLDQKTAHVNGKAIEMDVAPYSANGRTLIPAKYVGEFFGQKVAWDGEKRQVNVTEDKAAAAPSDLESWALPMGAMLARLNSGDPTLFGMYKRRYEITDPRGGVFGSAGLDKTILPQQLCRELLADSWGIDDRGDLIRTVSTMTAQGHNAEFLQAAAQGTSNLAPYHRQIAQKWGDRGILCWDLFRMSDLVQWGYLGGYLTYPEALALLEPAARRLQAEFSSWDEAYENYLDGYHWWSGEDMTGKSVWESARGKLYLTMKDPKKSASAALIFDDALFQTPITAVPGITAQQLLDQVTSK